MKLSSKVKTGEETQVGGSSTHAKGRYIFQVQEGIQLKINEKESGNSYTYNIPMTSVEAVGGDPDSVGRKLNEWINVMYNGDELNKGGFDLFSAILVHSGLMTGEEDVDITSQQFADHLAGALVDRLVGIEVGHRKEKMQEKNEDTGRYEDVLDDDGNVKMVNRAFPLRVFPAGAQKTGGAVQQEENTDW